MIDKDLFRLIGDERRYLAMTVVAMLFCLLCNIGIAFSVCRILDLLLKAQPASAYTLPAALLSIGILLRFLCGYLRERLRSILGGKVRIKMRAEVFDKMLRLGGEREGFTLSSMTQMALEGVEQLDLYFTAYIPQFFYALLAPAVLFIVLFFVSWKASLVLLFLVPLIPLSIVLFSKYAKRIFGKYWGRYLSMGNTFLDAVQGMRELKIFEAEERMGKTIHDNSEEFRRITMKVLVMQLFSTTIMDLIAYGGAGIGVAMVILDMQAGLLAPMAGLFVVLEAVEFFLPMRAFGSAFHVAMNGLSAGKRLLAFFEIEDPSWGNEMPQGASMALKDVTFAYEEGQNVLDGVSMTFLPGTMTAIVGESGSGKSTLVKLLLGEKRADRGEATIDGKDIQACSREGWLGKIGVVSYDSYIFHESIRDNFRMAKRGIEDEEILSLLKSMRLERLASGGEGLARVLNENANDISGGERQRLAMAIGMASDKPIEIYDEATSNIDVESERIIMSEIRERKKKGKTIVLISHRLENVISSDNIYFLKGGRVSEEGNHATLCQNGGDYLTLYRNQKDLESGYLRKAGKEA